MNYAIGHGTNGSKSTHSVGLSDIYQPIQSQLAAVDELLSEQIESASKPIADRLAATGLNSGKKIRPAMLLLAGGCFADLKKPHLAAAAALEMVHVATLVHDDVLDGAQERRHVPSLNSLCDNSTAILTGDYLFSKAFEVACLTGSMEAVRQIAQSSCSVCEGEIRQNLATGNLNLTKDEYFTIISMKTAQLCKVACGLGGVLSECDDQLVGKLNQFGEDLGMAFQIVDDVLDIVGNEERVGKTLGTDLLNRKMTLPIIHCLDHLSGQSREDLLNKLEAGISQPEAIEYLLKTDSISYARNVARQHANNALTFASELDESPYSLSLRQLAEFVLVRTH